MSAEALLYSTSLSKALAHEFVNQEDCCFNMPSLGNVQSLFYICETTHYMRFNADEMRLNVKNLQKQANFYIKTERFKPIVF